MSKDTKRDPFINPVVGDTFLDPSTGSIISICTILEESKIATVKKENNRINRSSTTLYPMKNIPVSKNIHVYLGNYSEKEIGFQEIEPISEDDAASVLSIAAMNSSGDMLNRAVRLIVHKTCFSDNLPESYTVDDIRKRILERLQRPNSPQDEDLLENNVREIIQRICYSKSGEKLCRAILDEISSFISRHKTKECHNNETFDRETHIKSINEIFDADKAQRRNINEQ